MSSVKEILEIRREMVDLETRGEIVDLETRGEIVDLETRGGKVDLETRVVKVARVPVVGVFTSSLAVILNLVRLVSLVVLSLFFLIAYSFKRDFNLLKNMAPLSLKYTVVFSLISIASSVFAIANIATLGFLSFGLKLSY